MFSEPRDHSQVTLECQLAYEHDIEKVSPMQYFFQILQFKLQNIQM